LSGCLDLLFSHGHWNPVVSKFWILLKAQQDNESANSGHRRQLRCQSLGLPKHINSSLAINGLRRHLKPLHAVGHSPIRIESPSSMTAVRRSSN
jgi:hypothetical protein